MTCSNSGFKCRLQCAAPEKFFLSSNRDKISIKCKCPKKTNQKGKGCVWQGKLQKPGTSPHNQKIDDMDVKHISCGDFPPIDIDEIIEASKPGEYFILLAILLRYFFQII